MKICKNCTACHLGFYKSRPTEWVCTGVKHPFVIEDVDQECIVYPESDTEKNVYQKYLIITLNKQDELSALKIAAQSSNEALTCAFDYYGGSVVSIEEFKMLCEHNEIKRGLSLFSKFTEEEIIYFGLCDNKSYVDELDMEIYT